MSLQKNKLPRSGCVINNGIEVPDNIEVFYSPDKKRPFYISGESFDTNTTSIRFLDTGEFEEIKSDRLKSFKSEIRKSVDTYWKSIKQSKSKTDVPGAWCEIV